jgi:hypothetical protein
MNLKTFTILGERCSGTHYLQYSILNNFELEYLKLEKHFFGHSELSNNPEMLYICLIRDPVEWIDSFFKRLHHVPSENSKDIDSFLNNEWRSIDDTTGIEIMEDRHIISKKRYTDIFELRQVKNEYLMSLKNKNTLILKYEDLRDNYDYILNQIHQQFCLTRKDNNHFVKIIKYKGTYDLEYSKKEILLKPEIIEYIKSRVDISQENKLGYLK